MSQLPPSLRAINDLPEDEKIAIYARLIPDWLYNKYDIEPGTFIHNGYQVARFFCPRGSRAVEITIKRDVRDVDPILYLNMADTFNQQLLVLLVIVNDPDAARFNIDIDSYGNQTQFGTNSRNIPAELAAMQTGLAPGQIRKGLRSFRHTVPTFEDFVAGMGHDMFLIEPLAYHNAIVFERYGFSYMRGLREMQRIHSEFQPGGELSERLSEDNPFRLPSAAQSIRGRSWAIHDGILGHPFTGFQMYKRLGIHAGVDTFPGAVW